MGYLGNAPARSFISFERQVFTIVNSQTAYTLSHSVTNENDIRLVVNNIVQEPGSGKAYTASGTTLTLSAALTNGTDEMYCVFLGRAVGTVNAPAGSVSTSQLAGDAVTEAKIADGAVESEHLNNNVISGQTELAAEPADTDEFLVSDAGTLKRIDYSHIKGGGITTGDMWRTSAHQTIPSSSTTVVSSWTQVAYLGSAMTVSSGIWTFPTTGVYLINYNYYAYKTSNMDYITTFLQTTTNNSSYGTVTSGDIQFDANYQTVGYSMIFDVTDTSTHKVRFAHYAPSDFSLRGGSEALTYAQFIRLGDT